MIPDERTELDVVFKDVVNYADICYHHMSDDDVARLKLDDNALTSQGWVRTAFGWRRLSPITAGLLQLFRHTAIPSISPTTLEEWIYRAEALYDAGIMTLVVLNEPEDPDDEPVPVPYRFTRSDITSHLNTYVSNPPDHWPVSKTDFDSYIRQLREARQRNAFPTQTD